MKISVDGIEILELSEIQKKVIQNDIETEIFEEDMKRRIEYILMHKYERCYARLKSEWDPKLMANGVEMIPTNPDAYCALVFSQPNYKSKSERIAEL